MSDDSTLNVNLLTNICARSRVIQQKLQKYFNTYEGFGPASYEEIREELNWLNEELNEVGPSLDSLPQPTRNRINAIAEIVNHATDSISFADVCEKFLNSDLAEHGKKAWEEVIKIHRPPAVSWASRQAEQLANVDDDEAGGDDRAGDGETNAAGLDRLTPAPRRAWMSWKLAEVNHAEILQDRAAYDWLNEQPDETFIGDLVGYELPAFATWQRYVREARKAAGESKNQSRTGRVAGSSVVKQGEI